MKFSKFQAPMIKIKTGHTLAAYRTVLAAQMVTFVIYNGDIATVFI